MSDEDEDRPQDVWDWLDSLLNVAVEIGFYLAMIATLVLALVFLGMMK